MDKLANRITCINIVHSYMNEVIPKLLKEINKSPVRIKETGQLFKKDKERLNTVLSSKGKLRAYIETSKFSNSISLNVDHNYKTGDETVQYYKQFIYLESNADFEPFEIYDIEHMRIRHMRAVKAGKLVREMQSDIRKITFITEG